MLAVFDHAVAKAPEPLKNQDSSAAAAPSSALKDGSLIELFKSFNTGSVSVNLGPSGFIAYSSHKQSPLLPRAYQQHCPLKTAIWLTKTANEGSILIEAYRTLRDRGPYPVDQDGSVPFFWGANSNGELVLCDDEAIVRKACGKSFAPFPKGCFYTSSGGLRSFEFPNKELKPAPWVDSSGQVCGVIFKIDEESRKESVMPRIGSGENWAYQY